MRCTAVLLAIGALPALLQAQQPQSTVPALPPISLPLAPIGLPPPTVTPPFAGGLPQKHVVAPRPADPGRHTGRPGHRDRKHRTSGTVVIFVPESFAWVDERKAGATHEAREQPGRLRVQIEPGDAQFFVDGVYAGTSSDGNTTELRAGIHQLEIRARGYEPAWLEVAIAPGQTTTYRGQLNPVPMEPPLPATPPQLARPRGTVYLLKGCYVGDVPPPPGSLPARCDVREMITYTTGELPGGR